MHYLDLLRKHGGLYFKCSCVCNMKLAYYMRNNYTEEAWLFLNHLSTIIGVNAIEEIASIGESKNISYKDLTHTLLKIKVGKVDGKWVVCPIKKSVQRLCGKMQFNPNDLAELKL